MAYRYKTIKVNGKTKLLHRHLMEQKLGRPLKRGEHVHHRNGDTHDNRFENLELLSAKDHQHHHKQIHPELKECAICGKSYAPKPTKRKRSQTCSWKCGHALSWRTRKSGPDVADALAAAQVGAQRELAEVSA